MDSNREREIEIEAIKRASDDLREEGMISTNINTYIARFSNIARTIPKERYGASENTRKSDREYARDLENKVNIFVYLRDTMQAKTVGEALKALEERRVDPKIIELWIEEGMFGIDIYLKEAVDKGYPELKSSLEEKRQEIFESWR